MNKKHAAKKLTGVLAGLLSAVILFGELSLGVLANFEVKVSAGSAKIRASADTSSNVLASVKSGDKLDAIEEVTGTDGSTWYKVNIDANTKGYIRSDLVSKTSGSSSGSSSTTTTTVTTTTDASVTTATAAPATTDVTAIAAQSATVTSNTVNVRKQASTSAAAVAKLNKGAVVTATGTAKGSDGKTWYQVTFINNGSEVTGFIREDLMQLGEAAAPTSADSAENGEAGEAVAVTEETTQAVEEQVPEPSPAPVLPEGVKSYELKYTEGTDGASDWYVYNNTDGYRMKLDELIQAQATNQSNQKKYEKQVGNLRLVLIILAVLFAAALTAAVIFFLKYRSELYEYDDEDDYDEEDDEDEDEEDEEEDEDDDVKIAPSRNARPAHPQGAPVHQGRPAAPGGQRPAGQGARPAGQGQRPAGQGQRPAGQGTRPAGQGTRSAGQGQRPAGQGTRPAGQGTRSAGTAPAGQQRPRPENGAHAAAGSRNGSPAPQTRRPAPADAAAKKNEMPWKSKNFLTEDEDLDFSFIDDDDLN